MSVVAWAFWAACALLEGYAITLVIETGSANRVELAESPVA